MAVDQFRRGAVTHLFYLTNWYHDKLYRLGFDEAAGNFQKTNFSGFGLGNDRVLSVASSKDLNAKLRALGFTVYDPDMSQFLLAGGGVHCMSQQLRRDPV